MSPLDAVQDRIVRGAGAVQRRRGSSLPSDREARVQDRAHSWRLGWPVIGWAARLQSSRPDPPALATFKHPLLSCIRGRGAVPPIRGQCRRRYERATLARGYGGALAADAGISRNLFSGVLAPTPGPQQEPKSSGRSSNTKKRGRDARLAVARLTYSSFAAGTAHSGDPMIFT